MTSRIDFLTQPEVRKYIRENINSDTTKLILNPPPDFKEHIKDIVNQIRSRQKAKGKLDNWAENYELVMPLPLSLEQASSSLTSKYKQGLISRKHLIDLTGGMGIDCLSLSDSFERTTYVEESTELCDVFQHNSAMLEKPIEIINAEAGDFLQDHKTDKKNTVAYIDPARRDQSRNRVFQIEDCSPNLIDLMPLLKKRVSELLIKYSPLLDINLVFKRIDGIKEVHVVSIKNDCKELLFLIDFEFVGTPLIRCVNLETNQPNFSFSVDEEHSANPSYDSYGRFIYEPNASILKAGAFKKIGEAFNLKKISENTHLYTSDQVIKIFPGRIYEVKEVAKKGSIKEYGTGGKINVVTRNYPLSAQELKKKWKLKDGGEYFLLAFRDLNGKPQMVIATRTDL